jgi:RNA-directed DNA polymerase
VRDGVVRRAIDKWLKAGVMEDGVLTRAGKGTPQGGVVSPILANVYLHEVIDTWYECDVRPRMRGKTFMLRFADDVVMVFAEERDARRVLEVLPKRLAKFGLTMSPEKTRLVEFRRPTWKAGTKRPNGRSGPGTFDFLGFTHSWGRSRKGRWTVVRRTSASRLKRAVKAIWIWCQRNRHWKVTEQHQQLSAKVRGHCAYYGITGNSKSLNRFRTQVERAWRFWLNRRSQRAKMTWRRFKLLKLRYPLPPARAIHSVYCGAAKPWS